MTATNTHKVRVQKAILILPILWFLSLSGNDLIGQNTHFFAPADTLHKPRFYSALGLGVTSFTATSIGLYNTWYKQFEQSPFHFFNDWNEWENMDKWGHSYTAYNLANIGYQGARWTGVSKKGSLLIAGIGSTAIQLTIEMMDGYSKKWGFSAYDLGFNAIGTSLFISQQMIWDEQRIRMKISSWPVEYPELTFTNEDGIEISSVNDRVNDLFGQSQLERFLKDYNAQTIWLSVNPRSFAPESSFPSWLNIALGYSAQNMLGGFENVWTVNGTQINFGTPQYERYQQFLLSLDLDLNKINCQSHALKGLLKVLNIFKIPAPAIEYNTLGEWRFHLLFRN